MSYHPKLERQKTEICLKDYIDYNLTYKVFPQETVFEQ